MFTRSGGCVAGLNDGFERLPLVLHIALSCLNEIRDEIVAALQLNIDLSKRVFVAVPVADETVVDPDGNEDRNENDPENNEDKKQGGKHNSEDLVKSIRRSAR